MNAFSLNSFPLPVADHTPPAEAGTNKLLPVGKINTFLLVLILITSALVLVPGWLWGGDAFTSFGEDLAAMVPSTATLFTFGSGAMLACNGSLRTSSAKRIMLATGFIAIAVAALNLLLILWGGSNGLDSAIWPSHPAFQTEQMSLATSVSFMLLGLALCRLPAWAPRDLIFIGSATLGAGISLLALVVYAFEAQSLYSVSLFTSMSLHTALNFAILFGVMLFARRDIGWMGVLVGSGRGSISARRMLPLRLGVPFILTLVVNQGLQAKLFDHNFQLSLLALCTMLLLGITAIREAGIANRAEIAHVEAVNNLAKAREEEHSLRSSRDSAEAAARVKSAFLANMSHEIRTPMNGVLGFAELLLDSGLEPKQREYAKLIAQSGHSMVTLLDDILDLSKIESGHMEIVDEPFDIRNTVQSTIKLMRGSAIQKGLKIDANIAEVIAQRVSGDSMRIRQILSNLIGNAIKFTDHGGITVSVKPADAGEQNLVEIAVSDTGIGIAPDRQKAVFGEFVQADNSTVRRFGGTGLGLPISRKLAEMMGGSLKLTSKPGQGTTVTAILPLQSILPALQVPEVGGSSALKHGCSENSSKSVLIAEDHDINQLVITDMLEQLGFATDLAEDGAQAVEMVRDAAEHRKPYDLVLMDVQMPNMDGLEATREIRRIGHSPDQLPIIAVTANAYSEDIRQCLDAGMQSHLAKPIRKDALALLMNEWLSPSGPGTLAE